MSETEVRGRGRGANPVGGEATEPAKAKRSRKGGTRASPFAKPIFVVAEVLDEAGQPMDFDPNRIRVLKVVREPGLIVAEAMAQRVSKKVVLVIQVETAPTA